MEEVILLGKNVIPSILYCLLRIMPMWINFSLVAIVDSSEALAAMGLGNFIIQVVESQI